MDLTRYSTLWKSQRVMAQVHRFVALCKKVKPARGVLTVHELRVAMTALVRQCQRESFSNDLESLRKNKCVDRHSKLLSFTPKTKRSNPTDLQLSALFAEVERFVNSRPITYVGSDPKDIEPLTPFHFWLHRRSPVIPLGD